MLEFTKKLTSVIISALLIFSVVTTVSAAESYKTWTQGDSRWADKSLGSCGDTMSEIGCAVTSIAILAAHSQSVSTDEFNPGVLCDYLSNNKGFDSYGNLYWAAITGLVPDFIFQKKANITSTTKSGIMYELAGYINQGYYIVLSVKNDGHWVAIDTITDGKVYMIDPAQNKNNDLFSYYDYDEMPQVRLYKGKTAPAKATTSSSSSSDNSSSGVSYLTGHYKTTSALNLRSSYSTSSDILTTIPSGKTVVVTRVNNNWGQVEYSGKSGWICLDYTEYTESSYSYKTGNYKVNVTSGVYLRRSIGTQSTALCLVPFNSSLTIDLVSANWGRTSYNGNTGWICMEYITYTDSVSTTPAVTTTVTTTTSKATTTTTAAKTTAKTTTSATTSLPLIKGDVNRDGKFTKRDLILLNNYIADPETASFDERYVMDVNYDTLIDEKDSVYLLKIINNQ